MAKACVIEKLLSKGACGTKGIEVSLPFPDLYMAEVKKKLKYG